MPNATSVIPETRTRLDGNRMVRDRPGSRTVIEMDNQMVRWATTPRITQEFLDRLGDQRKQNRRAPLGDKHGAWQKVCELPVSWLMGKIPPDAWEDRRAIAKLINDRDVRGLRTDGDGRTF